VNTAGKGTEPELSPVADQTVRVGRAAILSIQVVVECVELTTKNSEFDTQPGEVTESNLLIRNLELSGVMGVMTSKIWVREWMMALWQFIPCAFF
jgi:hypothetical protein